MEHICVYILNPSFSSKIVDRLIDCLCDNDVELARHLFPLDNNTLYPLDYLYGEKRLNSTIVHFVSQSGNVNTREFLSLFLINLAQPLSLEIVYIFLLNCQNDTPFEQKLLRFAKEQYRQFKALVPDAFYAIAVMNEGITGALDINEVRQEFGLESSTKLIPYIPMDCDSTADLMHNFFSNS